MTGQHKKYRVARFGMEPAAGVLLCMSSTWLKTTMNGQSVSISWCRLSNGQFTAAWQKICALALQVSSVSQLPFKTNCSKPFGEIGPALFAIRSSGVRELYRSSGLGALLVIHPEHFEV
jgi:hypothetical protein